VKSLPSPQAQPAIMIAKDIEARARTSTVRDPPMLPDRMSGKFCPTVGVVSKLSDPRPNRYVLRSAYMAASEAQV